MSMSVIEILAGNESVSLEPGWYLENRGSYVLLTTNIGCPYQGMEKRLIPETPYEVVLYFMGTAREVTFHIPGHGNTWEWDLYKVPHTQVPQLEVEDAEQWVYKEPKKIAPPLLRAKGGIYAHKEF